jgi:hypothetical protein
VLSLGEESIHIGVCLERWQTYREWQLRGVIHKVIHIGVVDKSLTGVDNYVTPK